MKEYLFTLMDHNMEINRVYPKIFLTQDLNLATLDPENSGVL